MMVVTEAAHLPQYYQDRPVIRNLSGCRVRGGVNTPGEELPRVRNGLGIAIVSTSQGVMSDKEARARRVGGEVLALVW